jgi:taurine--2-oxoglutarate transaminase
VVGTNGILVPPDGYLAGLRERCDRHGILLICDEVMSGFGRCGEWFAADHWNVTPDLITFAKGVNSGYVPLGGVILGPNVYETFAERVYPGGLTYSGHPLACAAAVATIHAMRDEQIVERTRRLGEELVRPRLGKVAGQAPQRRRGAWAGHVLGDRTRA